MLDFIMYNGADTDIEISKELSVTGLMCDETYQAT